MGAELFHAVGQTRQSDFPYSLYQGCPSEPEVRHADILLEQSFSMHELTRQPT